MVNKVVGFGGVMFKSVTWFQQFIVGGTYLSMYTEILCLNFITQQ